MCSGRVKPITKHHYGHVPWIPATTTRRFKGTGGCLGMQLTVVSVENCRNWLVVKSSGRESSPDDNGQQCIIRHAYNWRVHPQASAARHLRFSIGSRCAVDLFINTSAIKYSIEYIRWFFWKRDSLPYHCTREWQIDAGIRLGGVQTLRTQDTSDPGYFGTSAEVS